MFFHGRFGRDRGWGGMRFSVALPLRTLVFLSAFLIAHQQTLLSTSSRPAKRQAGPEWACLAS